jgi:hypothetical protein
MYPARSIKWNPEVLIQVGSVELEETVMTYVPPDHAAPSLQPTLQILTLETIDLAIIHPKTALQSGNRRNLQQSSETADAKIRVPTRVHMISSFSIPFSSWLQLPRLHVAWTFSDTESPICYEARQPTQVENS